MNGPVNLDDQTKFGAVEIDNVLTDEVLPTELKTE
jgi:hypothetical protein